MLRISSNHKRSSHNLSLPQPFTSHLEPICSSLWFHLDYLHRLDLLITGVCFSFFFYFFCCCCVLYLSWPQRQLFSPRWIPCIVSYRTLSSTVDYCMNFSGLELQLSRERSCKYRQKICTDFNVNRWQSMTMPIIALQTNGTYNKYTFQVIANQNVYTYTRVTWLTTKYYTSQVNSQNLQNMPQLCSVWNSFVFFYVTVHHNDIDKSISTTLVWWRIYVNCFTKRHWCSATVGLFHAKSRTHKYEKYHKSIEHIQRGNLQYNNQITVIQVSSLIAQQHCNF